MVVRVNAEPVAQTLPRKICKSGCVPVIFKTGAAPGTDYTCLSSQYDGMIPNSGQSADKHRAVSSVPGIPRFKNAEPYGESDLVPIMRSVALPV